MPTPLFPSLSRRHFITNSLVGGALLGLGVKADAEVAPPPARKLGVALCGLGSYASGQLGPALRKTQYCRLAGVVTGDPAKGRRWARDYGFPESSVYSYETMHRMADNPDIDILYSVTPNSLHKRDTLAGFAAGKHVISEKPMALDVAECDAMIAAAARAGRQLGIGYRLHYHPYWERLKHLAAAETYGPLNRISGEFSFHWGSNRAWRLERSMGGGPMMDVGIYVLYASAMAKNELPPAWVSAKFHPVTRPEVFDSVEEGVSFTLEYADGSVCNGETSWSRNANRYRAEGPEGWMDFSAAFHYDGLRASTSSDGALKPMDGYNEQAAQMDAFARDVTAGRPTLASGTMGRREIRIIEAIMEAARTGTRVHV